MLKIESEVGKPTKIFIDGAPAPWVQGVVIDQDKGQFRVRAYLPKVGRGESFATEIMAVSERLQQEGVEVVHQGSVKFPGSTPALYQQLHAVAAGQAGYDPDRWSALGRAVGA